MTLSHTPLPTPEIIPRAGGSKRPSRRGPTWACSSASRAGLTRHADVD
jgi:hypothetical protein